MQLMPATARTVAKQNGYSYKADLLIDDPDYNIRLGSAYLDSLLSDYGGSYVLSLAAYNAGPGRVRNAGGVPPIAETRAYVASIVRRISYSTGASQ